MGLPLYQCLVVCSKLRSAGAQVIQDLIPDASAISDLDLSDNGGSLPAPGEVLLPWAAPQRPAQIRGCVGQGWSPTRHPCTYPDLLPLPGHSEDCPGASTHHPRHCSMNPPPMFNPTSGGLIACKSPSTAAATGQPSQQRVWCQGQWFEGTQTPAVDICPRGYHPVRPYDFPPSKPEPTCLPQVGSPCVSSSPSAHVLASKVPPHQHRAWGSCLTRCPLLPQALPKIRICLKLSPHVSRATNLLSWLHPNQSDIAGSGFEAR